jgi:methyl-accepting chemotaxis protein
VAYTRNGGYVMRFVRLSVRGKVILLGAVGVVVALVIGIVSIVLGDRARSANELSATLVKVNSQLAELDRLCSEDQIAERNMLLATSDPLRNKATGEANASRQAAQQMWTALDGTAGVPGDVRTQLSTLHQQYSAFLDDVDQQLRILSPIDPGTPEADAALVVTAQHTATAQQQIRAARDFIGTRDDQARAKAASVITTIRTVVLAVGLVALVVLITAVVLISRSITGPLAALRSRMSEIADGDGDLTARLDEAARDEIGDVARAANRFISRVQVVVRQMAGAAGTLTQSVQSLSGLATQLSSGAEGTRERAGVVSHAAEEVSRNITTLSAGSEEMGSAIHEIASNASEAAQVAANAVSVANSASSTISELAQASSEVGNVVKLITSIAEQTNLLALNATIEAARAGESGKGFAVVAGEVKDLAQETAKATEDITRRISAIQAGTNAAAQAIANIADVVGKINDYSATIATAVEEQSATSSEMARNVSEAASGSGEIANTITGVAEAANDTAQAATAAAQTTDEVSSVVGELQTTVGRFRY